MKVKLKYTWLAGLVVLLVGHFMLYGGQGNALGFLASYLFAGLVIALLAWLSAFAINWGSKPRHAWHVWANVSVGIMWGLELSVRILGLGA